MIYVSFDPRTDFQRLGPLIRKHCGGVGVGVRTGRVAGAQDRGKPRSVLVQPDLLGHGGDGEHVRHAAQTQLAAGEAARGQVHGESRRGHGRGAVRNQRHGVRLLLDRQSTWNWTFLEE